MDYQTRLKLSKMGIIIWTKASRKNIHIEGHGVEDFNLNGEMIFISKRSREKLSKLTILFFF